MLNTKRYPFSTTDGRHIPLDVIRPHSLMLQSIPTGVATGAIAVPDEVEVISFYATVDCIVMFDDEAEIPIDGQVLATAVFLPAFTTTVVAATADNFSVLGIADTGVLCIGMLDSWQGLSLEVQNSRR